MRFLYGSAERDPALKIIVLGSIYRSGPGRLPRRMLWYQRPSPRVQSLHRLVRGVPCYGYLTVSHSSMTTDWPCSHFLYAHSDHTVQLLCSITLRPHTVALGRYG